MNVGILQLGVVSSVVHCALTTVTDAVCAIRLTLAHVTVLILFVGREAAVKSVAVEGMDGLKRRNLLMKREM